jgi:hypothetical protein
MQHRLDSLKKAIKDPSEKLKYLAENVKHASWINDWIAANPNRKTELLTLVDKLNCESTVRFGNMLVYHWRNAQQTDPIELLKRDLTFQAQVRKRRELIRRAKKINQWTLTLANGLQCVIKAENTDLPQWFYWTATFKRGKIRVTFDLYIDQVARLETNATKNIKSLERMHPRGMTLYINRRKALTHWQMYPAVLKALAQNFPIEIAPLLSPPASNNEF